MAVARPQLIDELPPLSARSVIASTLLGTEPPRLPGQLLVRIGRQFGIAEGTVRVAMSRMLAAGELVVSNGVYELAGRLRERQRRQDRSRHPQPRAWNGSWRLAVVVAEGRSADERTELRSAMRVLRFAELREGVWLRPDNLELDPTAAAVADSQCTWFRSETDESLAVDELFEVDSWKRRALDLSVAMSEVANDLERGSTEALVPGFILDAAVLRHFLADPLLPRELLPFDWPGQTLRHDYERYDSAFKRVLGDFFSAERATLSPHGS